ncbi:MAG: hypothetical protein C4527_02995 [Candidatus Omnitrophota bacterium]|nr:MAG: hypothetical protein C4527_02995 [Candidatus Omnitrophota bacterium]
MGWVKGYVTQSAYTASRHALMGFTKMLALEEPTHSRNRHDYLDDSSEWITINSLIMPGRCAGDFHD